MIPTCDLCRSVFKILRPLKRTGTIIRNNGKFNGCIPINKLTIEYSRSSAPGGQNVNKVNTKVDLRFHVQSADWLSDDIKRKLLDTCKSKVTKDGFFIIKSEQTRSQYLNLQDAVNKLREIIKDLDRPEPVISAETKALIEKRLEKKKMARITDKRKRSMIKRDRQAPDVYFD